MQDIEIIQTPQTFPPSRLDVQRYCGSSLHLKTDLPDSAQAGVLSIKLTATSSSNEGL